MLRFAMGAAAAALCLSTLPAQIRMFGGPAERAATSVLLFEGGMQSMCGMSISYGQPAWKAEYDQMAEEAKGQRVRLGKDWWTSFDTSVPVELGGVRIPAGSYFLGLEADEDGGFALALLDAKQAMQNNQLPFDPRSWDVAYTVPMKLEKDALEDTQELLTIALEAEEDAPTDVTLAITWGKHRLSTDGRIEFGGAVEASHEKSKSDADNTKKEKGEK